MKKPTGIKVIIAIHLLLALFLIINISITLSSYQNNMIDMSVVLLLIISILAATLLVRNNIWGWGLSILFFIIQSIVKSVEFRHDTKLVLFSITIYIIPIIYLFKGNVLEFL